MAIPVFALNKRNVPVSMSHNKHLEGEQQVAVAMPITSAPEPIEGVVVSSSQTAVRRSHYVRLMEWSGVS